MKVWACYPWKFSPLKYDSYYTIWSTGCSVMWWPYDILCALDMLCDLSRCYVVYAINVVWSFMGTRSCRPYRLCNLVCTIRFTTCYSCMSSTYDTFLWWFLLLLCIDDILLSFLCWDCAFLLLFMILICIVVFISTHWVFIYT